jgi:hypothetical protein
VLSSAVRAETWNWEENKLEDDDDDETSTPEKLKNFASKGADVPATNRQLDKGIPRRCLPENSTITAR